MNRRVPLIDEFGPDDGWRPGDVGWFSRTPEKTRVAKIREDREAHVWLFRCLGLPISKDLRKYDTED